MSVRTADEIEMVKAAIRSCRRRHRACTIKALADELDMPKWKAQMWLDQLIGDGLLAKTSVPGSIHVVGE